MNVKNDLVVLKQTPTKPVSFVGVRIECFRKLFHVGLFQ